MCGYERVPGETVLMFRLQMTEISNPKHGCVIEMHASVRCQPVGMLTDDAPDSSSLHSSPPPSQSLSDFTDPNPPTLPQSMGKIVETHSQIIQRAPLLNM